MATTPQLIVVLGHIKAAERAIEDTLRKALPDSSRKKCRCGGCQINRLPIWRYTRNPTWPCLPTSPTLNDKPQGHGCGVSLSEECLPGCPNTTQQAEYWNKAHGVLFRVCTHCGMEVHHPPREGCDGEQHEPHQADKCPCRVQHSDLPHCGMCNAALKTPYVGDGHGPNPKSLKEHKASCIFRKHWAAAYKKKPPKKWRAA